MFVRRATTVAVAAVAAVTLSTGPASAHFCWFSDPNENANSGRAGSSAFRTFESLAFQFTGLCDDGIAILADAAGVETDTLINGRGTMAGGRPGGNKAISHLDFAAIEAAMPAAAAACD